MAEIVLTLHAKDMLRERKIAEEWLWHTIEDPDRKERYPQDNNLHYTKAIPEAQGRVLHVVVNDSTQPNRIVTVFFDRRLRTK